MSMVPNLRNPSLGGLLTPTNSLCGQQGVHFTSPFPLLSLLIKKLFSSSDTWHSHTILPSLSSSSSSISIESVLNTSLFAEVPNGLDWTCCFISSRYFRSGSRVKYSWVRQYLILCFIVLMLNNYCICNGWLIFSLQFVEDIASLLFGFVCCY